ncbi:unnamed protein product [Phyllotreta striolata]|uniref:Metalloendopeptidase n=1 Tax=Phyllotreta striolata TaxID=444603 RepID=A0A9N9TPS1_PHYSR|nr:unnamed protein product [Phyllotreta striolata]
MLSVTLVTLVLLANDQLVRGSVIRQTKINRTRFEYTIDDLRSAKYPMKTSDDFYMDPCKARNFLEDIALTPEDSVEKWKKSYPTIEKEYKQDENQIKGNKESLGNKEALQNRLNEEVLSKRIPTEEIKLSHVRLERAVATKIERIWDYGVIPYEIDDSFSGWHKALFKQAMRHWENFTCIKFVERNPADHQNYIVFMEKSCGCCSFVGKKGNGAQAISIGRKCDKFGIVVHELGHVIGFWHEHTRPDRDDHVTILKENILTGQDYNFKKLNKNDISSLGVYDYNSIMHYARNTFSKASYLDTIQPINVPEGVHPNIGQRIKLSEGDIEQANILYQCPKCGNTFQKHSASFSSPVYWKTVPKEGVNCEWRITATHGEKITLNISNLDIRKEPNCKTDFLEIRDGYWFKSPLLGVFCGTGNSILVKSTGSRMLVTYVSKNPSGYSGFTANYEAVCGGELTIDSEDHLESPNYPDEYRENIECIWKLTVPKTYQVALRFQSFDLENHDNCAYDYLEIRDGIDSNSPVTGVYCGHKIPSEIISTSNEMTIRFLSDGSVQKTGFSAVIFKEYDECAKVDHGCAQLCVNTLGSFYCSCRIGFELHSDGKNCQDACGGVFNQPNGTITSPLFPNLYPANKNCTWEIIASPQHKITVNFTHFDLEGNWNPLPQQHCEYDKIEIFSKLESNEYKSHGEFCGERLPNVITSKSNTLRIVFSSDSTVQKSGFAAIFSAEKDECAVDNGGCEHDCIKTPGTFRCSCHVGYNLAANGRSCKEGDCTYEVTAPHGIVNSPNYPGKYPPKKNCFWHFGTINGHRIRLAFLLFDLEPSHQACEYDRVEVFDGASPAFPTLGKFCGSSPPPVIQSSGNHMYMTFVSDSSMQKNGFHVTHSTVCGGILEATFRQRHIYSHVAFGKENYGNQTNCDWTIEARGGFNIRLSFAAFDVEEERGCGYDYVEVFDGLDSSERSFGKLCGSEIPSVIISSQGGLLVQFSTDESITRKGFDIIYESYDDFLVEDKV